MAAVGVLANASLPPSTNWKNDKQLFMAISAPID
jgi:hypothetical protein